MTGSNVEPTSFEVVFPLAMFDIEAIKRSAYVLMSRATISFDVSNSEVRCSIKATSPDEQTEDLERDFRREVVDQDLRISIETQTAPMRNAILGLTFSKTGLQE